MKIVCIGDSLTYGYGVRRSEAWTSLLEEKYDIEIINEGINGDTTTGMLARFYKDVIEHKPKYVVIMGGVNDLVMGVPLSIIRSNISSMVYQAYAKGIVPIIGLSILCDPEMASKEWTTQANFHKINNDLLQLREWAYEFVERLDIQIIDFCVQFQKKVEECQDVSEWYLDGLHPTPKGNRIMAEIFQIRENI